MSALNTKWIVLGRYHFNAEYLRSVTEKEALEHWKDKAVHPDRVRNAWKQANNFKDSNKKK